MLSRWTSLKISDFSRFVFSRIESSLVFPSAINDIGLSRAEVSKVSDSKTIPDGMCWAILGIIDE